MRYTTTDTAIEIAYIIYCTFYYPYLTVYNSLYCLHQVRPMCKELGAPAKKLSLESLMWRILLYINDKSMLNIPLYSTVQNVRYHLSFISLPLKMAMKLFIFQCQKRTENIFVRKSHGSSNN